MTRNVAIGVGESGAYGKGRTKWSPLEDMRSIDVSPPLLMPTAMFCGASNAADDVRPLLVVTAVLTANISICMSQRTCFDGNPTQQSVLIVSSAHSRLVCLPE